ncbi:MAG: efflux RND transporter periplasmic adaptor subunit [Burkholderiales bacterium]|nr:efflux RND transporter periplasmic adaptor subunit [Burkholderiales bacterium]
MSILKKNKKKIYIILFALAIVVGFFVIKHEKPENTKIANEILLNKTDISQSKVESISDVVNFTGDLNAKEQTVISAEVDARILKIWVDEGQIVKKGQSLADLDTLDLSEAVSQQQAQVAASKAKLDIDNQKMTTQSQLLKQGFISQIAYDELVSNYKSSLEKYKAEQASLKRSQKQLSNTHIVAPFDGVVFQRNVEQGQLALKNTKLFSIANLSQLEIRAAIPSDQINRVSVGQKVLFTAEADDTQYTGQVMRINQVSETGTRSYMVYISFDNKDKLKSGQFVRGSLIINTLSNQIVIPCDTIRSNDKGEYVLISLNNTVSEKSIKTNLMNKGTGKCAVSGLAVNTTVLSANVLNVKPNDKIKLMD